MRYKFHKTKKKQFFDIFIFKLTPHEKIIPASIKFDCLQSKCSRSRLAKGAKANVPNPEPHTAIPVASDRFVSK